MQKVKINFLRSVIHNFGFGASFFFFPRRDSEHAFEPIRQKDFQASERHNDTSATQTSSSSLVVFIRHQSLLSLKSVFPEYERERKKRRRTEERGAKRDARHKYVRRRGSYERAKDLFRLFRFFGVRSFVRSFASVAVFDESEALFVPYVSSLARGKKKDDEGGNANSWPCTRTRSSWTNCVLDLILLRNIGQKQLLNAVQRKLKMRLNKNNN